MNYQFPWTDDEDGTWMPVTMQQFENLTNEILTEVNKITAPHAFDANYMAQILMSALHHYEHTVGLVSKRDLLKSCINRISCHVTYHAVQEIQKKLNLENEPESDDGLAPVIPFNQATAPNDEQH